MDGQSSRELDIDIADAFQDHIGSAERREQTVDDDKDVSEIAQEFGLDT